MQEEHIHNPFQFEYASSTRKFSLSAKVMAVVFVLIFMLIPLYEICPETFKLNSIFQYVPCPPGSNCGCFG